MVNTYHLGMSLSSQKKIPNLIIDDYILYNFPGHMILTQKNEALRLSKPGDELNMEANVDHKKYNLFLLDKGGIICRKLGKLLSDGYTLWTIVVFIII